jgi:superfamily II DNA/RNA helicase
MVDQSEKDLIEILEHLKEFKIQYLCFSATFNEAVKTKIKDLIVGKSY